MKLVRAFLIVSLGVGLAWAEESADEPAEIEQLSEEEMSAEMERIEQALGEGEELKEFIPTKPLAADLPVALPSDI